MVATGFSAALALLLSQVGQAAARLGSPENSTGLPQNTTVRSRHAWEPENFSHDLLETNGTRAANAHRYAGYATFATTTRYGDAKAAACGGMHTGQLTAGLPYYSVASAQSMWQGCCWCQGPGGGYGTMGLGCFSCAKGRFLHSAYGLKGHSLKSLEKSGFASEEIVIVVADLCPYQGNERWCPERPGQRNDYGAHNHLDFSHPPPGIDNHNFVFTPIECPHDLRERYNALSRCVR
ncbi:egl5 [Symbiodinium natans]|uniref:Egl5 protein n=1 Tax=Symbiodinium natans TaxID=878477 RepID=A0A812TNZ0_9DINO|nr:egl5 [Symbiodinium natans]